MSVDRNKSYAEYELSTMSDVFIQFAFGTEKYKPAILAFINAVLMESNKPLITELTIKNPFNPGKIEIDKKMILDVSVVDETSRAYNIEVQTYSHRYLIERCLYYWSNLYSCQLKEGEHYTRLKPVTSIILTGFQVMKNMEKLHYSFGIFSHDEQRIELTDHFLMHFLRVPERECRELLDQVSSPLREWLIFFGYPGQTTEAELREAAKKEKGVEIMCQAYEEFCQDPDLRDIALRQEMYRRDQYAIIEDARIQGTENGLAIGEERGIAIGREQGIAIGEEQGIAIGEERGREQGIAIGEERGIAIGERNRAIITLLKYISWNLGPISSELEVQIKNLPDLDLLDQLAEGIGTRQILTLEELAERLP